MARNCAIRCGAATTRTRVERGAAPSHRLRGIDLTEHRRRHQRDAGRCDVEARPIRFDVFADDRARAESRNLCRSRRGVSGNPARSTTSGNTTASSITLKLSTCTLQNSSERDTDAPDMTQPLAISELTAMPRRS